MNANDIQYGDVISKPPFWSNPMRVVNKWTAGDGIYADVAYADGGDNGRVNVIPMQLSPASHGRVLSSEITWITRAGVVVFERERAAEEEAV